MSKMPLTYSFWDFLFFMMEHVVFENVCPLSYLYGIIRLYCVPESDATKFRKEIRYLNHIIFKIWVEGYLSFQLPQE